MANRFLFVSAWLLLVLPHFWGLLFFSGPAALHWLYIAGPCTSVWNHGTTSAAAQIADRIVMALGLLYDVACALQLIPAHAGAVLALDAAAVACYLIAKRRSCGNAWHSLSHACVSAAHLSMLVAYAGDDDDVDTPI